MAGERSSLQQPELWTIRSSLSESAAALAPCFATAFTRGHTGRSSAALKPEGSLTAVDAASRVRRVAHISRADTKNGMGNMQSGQDT